MKRIVLLSLILITGCTSLKTVSSLSEEKGTTNDFTNYNETHKLHYQVSNDQETLHLALKTTDRTAIMKILRTGLTVYFDVKGKKKKNIYFQYPISRKGETPRPNTQQRQGQRQSGEQRPQMNLETMVEQIPHMAVFSHSGVTEQIFYDLKESDIQVFIEATQPREITYDLIIPIHRISENGIADLSNLSVGIISGKFEMPSAGSGGGRPGGGRPGGASGARPGGGRSGARAGGGRPGGGRSGGGQSQDRSAMMTAMTTPINFWFKVDLFQ